MNSNGNLKMAVWGLSAAVVVLFSAVGYAIRDVQNAATDARKAECALRIADQRQINETNRFFRDHPQALKALGATQRDIQRQTRQLREEIKALAVASC